MSKIWDKVYSNDSAFFGEKPSDLAQKCYSDFKKYGVKMLLELGCRQGRDTIFFASNDLDSLCSRILKDNFSVLLLMN